VLTLPDQGKGAIPRRHKREKVPTYSLKRDDVKEMKEPDWQGKRGRGGGAEFEVLPEKGKSHLGTEKGKES